ncbi:flagellar biosynthesis anti-sigma factor FlgM [Paenibacillus sp. FSL W8-1187]|uniref:flagellar biosynthesis anti-sigma factor FlgM n=1 Tax=Paenibacillus TaxID=44249 RepID=UPI000C797B26|nr:MULTISPECIES: flagellar biosynthesis anti-sigma factor FlgM [Paenibacillus]QGG58103.1 flagellar biosynthesis anti-sigma factor FlgM [Paenibacillus sp. B01]
MKINDTGRVQPVHTYQKQSEARVSESARTRKTDQVQISEEAKAMLASRQPESAERKQRIQELKNEVAAGTYRVDAGKIADKLWDYLN